MTSRISAGNPAWAIRAVQLDLARHMENVEYIRRYTDLAAEAGFNALVFYLEARVRTRSFPFRPRQETYSLDEMAGVVEHARGAGMDTARMKGNDQVSGHFHTEKPKFAIEQGPAWLRIDAAATGALPLHHAGDAQQNRHASSAADELDGLDLH